MLTLPLQDAPSDSPTASRSAPPGTTRRAEPRPARQRRRLGGACQDPLTHPLPRSSIGPIRGVAGFRAGTAGRPAPTPGPPGSTSRTSPWRAGHAGSPSGRPLPPGCGRRTPVWTPSPPMSPPCGDPAAAGRATDMAELSSVRSAGHPQFNVTAQPIGMDPVRTAAAKRRTPPAPSIRPCVRSAGHRQPRGLHVLALTGPDTTAMRMLPSATPAATSIGTRPS
jgi:hypothetical protein